MRTIKAAQIKDVVRDLCVQANLDLRRDVLSALKAVYRREKNKRAKSALGVILKNAAIARQERLAICQDTGLPCVFVELGQDARILGDLKAAIQKGLREGYQKFNFRNSIVRDPFKRGASGYTPGLIHFDIVRGSRVKITVLPKGFGCENKTMLKMFNPSAGIAAVKEFIVDTVRTAGPDACPPYLVGVGVGGSADYACFLAKKALLMPVNPSSSFSRDTLKSINALEIGPLGLGGSATALAVNVLTYPTHIAGLPVAVNISCHAARSATKVI